MYRPLIQDYIEKSEWSWAAASGLPAAPVKFTVDRTNPIDCLKIIVYATLRYAVAPTCTADGLLNIVRRITVTAYGQDKPLPVVDVSGAGLIKYLDQVYGLDRATRYACSFTPHVGVPIEINTDYAIQLTYLIPFAHPQLADPLRLRCALPVDLHKQDLQVAVEFGAAAEIDNQFTIKANTNVTMTCEVLRRDVPAELVARIASMPGGWLPSQIVETDHPMVATTSEHEIEIPQPGFYSGLLLTGYTDAATPAWPYDAGKGISLQDTGYTRRKFRPEHVITTNEASQPFIKTGQLVRNVADNANTAFLPPGWAGVAYIDFLTDGIGPDTSGDLGSLLDCTPIPMKSRKIRLVGPVTGGAAKRLKVIGHRFNMTPAEMAHFQPLRF